MQQVWLVVVSLSSYSPTSLQYNTPIMSFMKGLADRFSDMLSDKDKDKKEEGYGGAYSLQDLQVSTN